MNSKTVKRSTGISGSILNSSSTIFGKTKWKKMEKKMINFKVSRREILFPNPTSMSVD